MECRNDEEAISILGRGVIKQDITADYVVWTLTFYLELMEAQRQYYL